MQVDTFQEFVEQRRQSAEDLNCEERLASWRRELDSLYAAMEGYLKGYTGIRTERRPVQLTEQYLGSYEVPALAILIGREEVIAEPVGTLLIGSSGRVDLSGPRRILRIVLLEKSGPVEKVTISGTDIQEETVTRSPLRREIDHRGWYLMTPPPAATATPLNADSFREAVMDVVGG